MHESTSGSSSGGKQLKKRVTFGEPVVVGVSGEGDGTEVWRYRFRLRHCSRVESCSCKHNWPQHHTSL